MIQFAIRYDDRFTRPGRRMPRPGRPAGPRGAGDGRGREERSSTALVENPRAGFPQRPLAVIVLQEETTAERLSRRQPVSHTEFLTVRGSSFLLLASCFLLLASCFLLLVLASCFLLLASASCFCFRACECARGEVPQRIGARP